MPLDSEFARVCRVCLQVCPVDAEMMSLFTSDLQLAHSARSLLTLAGITIDKKDTLPQQICQECSDCLNNALAFKLKCERSHFYLQHVRQTHSYIAPGDLCTNLQSSMFADMVQFTPESSRSVNVKLESDDFKRQLNNVGVKIEVLENIYDNGPEDPDEVSHDDFLDLNLNDSSQPQNTQEVNMARLDVSIARKRVKDPLTAAEIRLRDLICKHERQNKKIGTPIHSDTMIVASKLDQVTEHSPAALVNHTHTQTITPIQTSQPKPILETCNAKRRHHKGPSEKVAKLKASLKNYLAMNPVYPKATVKVARTSDISSHELDCKICDKTFSSNCALRTHVLRHGPPAVCEHCGKTFGGKSELLFHCMARHGHKRDWQCGHCGYEAMSRPLLIEHIRLHTGERPYACDTCGMAFRRRDIMRKHRLRHFEAKFKCEECHKGYYEQCALNAHVRERHRKLQRRFHCTQPGCDVSYVKVRNMRRHLSVMHKIPRDQQGVLKTRSPLEVA